MSDAGQNQKQGELAKLPLAEGGRNSEIGGDLLEGLSTPKTGPDVGSETEAWSKSPRSRRRRTSRRALGQEERLRRVRFLTLPFSRKDSRRRMAGGEVRLGISAMYITT